MFSWPERIQSTAQCLGCPEPSVQSFFTGTLKFNLGKICLFIMLFLPSEEIIGWYFGEIHGSHVH